MDTKTLVAVLYNDIPPTSPATDTDFQTPPLHFKPAFDLEVSDTEEEIAEIVEALRKEGLDVFSFNLRDRFEDLIKVLTERRPDVVFNLVESHLDSPLSEMTVTSVYEMLGIPYTGSPPLTLALCQRKGLAKQILLANGIPTPPFKLITEGKTFIRHGLRYPIIVKPGREDGSHGVENESVVFNLRELKQQVERILDEFHQPVIMERFIDGRELNVSILGWEELVVLPISEIDFSSMPDSLINILTYQAKWEPRHVAYHRTIPICPARLSKKMEKRIKGLALKAYKIMGCRDYARVDLRLDRKNNPFVLEVNPNPHLSEGMGLMRSAETCGFSFAQTLRKIVEFALRRSKKVKSS
ncbi:MAG: ATP-grasp domain-containing protein [Thermodesulfobacteriota bacterium]